MNNFVLRAATGILFVALLVGGIVLSPLTYTLLFAVVTGLSVWEFCTLMNEYAGAQTNRFIATMAGVYLFLANTAFYAAWVGPEVFVPYILAVIYLLVGELYLQKPDPLKNWAYAFAAQLYVALPFAVLSNLAFFDDPLAGSSFGNQYYYVLPLSIFLFLWTSDTGAYCCGSLLHKRFPAKLFERVSPNKSWVGSLGGGVLCLCAAVVLWHFHRDVMTLPQWAGLGLVVCVFGTWGDLVESLLKRQLGIKDSGRILPGHGGMLDRFDSSLLAIPAAVLYFFTLGFFR